MENPPGLAVQCRGYEDVEGHVEYLFDVIHASGATWGVRWRFSELFAADAKLRRSLRGLPPFPPRGPPGLSLLLGVDTLAQRRAAALQLYFEGALACPEVWSAKAFCGLLGMRPPDTVAEVQVLRWLPAGECPSGTAAVELRVSVGVAAEGGPAEELRASFGPLTRAMAASSQGPPGQPLCVRDLPCGETVCLEVRAANRVGTSRALAVELAVPGERKRPVVPGARVRAVWAGDGARYDAVVKSLAGDGCVLLNWLRPAPLSGEVLKCVCETGGDDTAHRVVPRALVLPLGADVEPDGGAEQPECGSPAAAFCLGVRLDDGRQVEELRWQSPDELLARIDAFMASTHLKPLFREPVLQHAELMVREGRQNHSVDVVDLL